MNLAHRRLTPVFIFMFSLAEALLIVASAMMYACTTFGLVCVFSVGYSSTPESMEPVL